MFKLPKIEQNTDDMHYILDNLLISPEVKAITTIFDPPTLSSRVLLKGRNIVWMCLLKQGILASGDTGLLDFDADVLIEIFGKMDKLKSTYEKMWEKGSAFLESLSESTSQTGSAIKESVGGAIESVKESTQEAAQATAQGVKSTAEGVKEKTPDVSQQLKDLVAQFQNLTTALSQDVRESSATEIKDESITQRIEETAKKTEELIERIAEPVKARTKQAVRESAEYLKQTTHAAKETVQESTSAMYEKSGDVKEQVAQGIETAGKAAQEFAETGTTPQVLNPIKERSDQALEASREQVKGLTERMSEGLSEKLTTPETVPREELAVDEEKIKKETPHDKELPTMMVESPPSTINPALPNEPRDTAQTETEEVSSMETQPSTTAPSISTAPTEEGRAQSEEGRTQSEEAKTSTEEPSLLEQAKEKLSELTSSVTETVKETPTPMQLHDKAVEKTEEIKQESLLKMKEAAEQLPFTTHVKVHDLKLKIQSDKQWFYDSLKGVLKLVVEDKINEALRSVGKLAQ